MNAKRILLTISVTLLLLNSCRPVNNYSTTPKIDLRYVIVKDSLQEDLGYLEKYYLVAFKIVDGDWNFGIDTTKDYYQNGTHTMNYFAKLYYNDNGNIYEYELPAGMNLNGMVPYVPPVGLNDYYKATIIREFSIPIQIDKPIRFEFYVEDHELNRSNTQITPWILPDYTGTLVDTNNLIID